MRPARGDAGLDAAVLLGVWDADLPDGPHSVHDPRVRQTQSAIEQFFAAELPINRRRQDRPALGRYKGDSYFGGGAWYPTTLAAAGLYYRLASSGGREAGEWLRRGDGLMQTVRELTPRGGALSEHDHREPRLRSSLPPDATRVGAQHLIQAPLGRGPAHHHQSRSPLHRLHLRVRAGAPKEAQGLFAVPERAERAQVLESGPIPVVRGSGYEDNEPGAAARERRHLPAIVDPSHALGRRDLVVPMSKASLVVGAAGLMVEVHPDPGRALCDGPQSLDPAGFRQLTAELGALRGQSR